MAAVISSKPCPYHAQWKEHCAMSVTLVSDNSNPVPAFVSADLLVIPRKGCWLLAGCTPAGVKYIRECVNARKWHGVALLDQCREDLDGIPDAAEEAGLTVQYVDGAFYDDGVYRFATCWPVSARK
jgi:hypothetical protein